MFLSYILITGFKINLVKLIVFVSFVTGKYKFEYVGINLISNWFWATFVDPISIVNVLLTKEYSPSFTLEFFIYISTLPLIFSPLTVCTFPLTVIFSVNGQLLFVILINSKLTVVFWSFTVKSSVIVE